MKKLITLFTLVALSIPAHADDSWKKPLRLKEKEIEQGIQLKHNIMGLYPSMVQIPRNDGPADITTLNPMADIQHAVCWTANYLAGLSYKYAFLKRSGAPQEEVDAARRRADEVFEGVYRCQLVTGRRGLQARGYFLGHGETYAERYASTKLPFWRQGVVDGQHFRWVGDPSHHNYSDTIHGLGQYYTLAAEGSQKDRAREAIDALVSYWVDNDLRISKFDRSLPDVPILGFTDGRTLNTRVFMAIAGAKVAHYATGKPKFKETHDKLIEQYGVRQLRRFRTGKSFDDGEHVFCHLDLLSRIEDDPELRAAYRKVADGLWANHKDDAQSLFTYIYFSIAPDGPERDEALQEALYTLQTFPTDMTLKPRKNSLFPERKPPFPTYQAAWDNEYIWKAHLLRPDGWLSRSIIDVAVSPEDSSIIYAVGQDGVLYQSRDGAATWQNWIPLETPPHQSVQKVEMLQKNRILMIVCTGGFYLSTTAGHSWTQLPVPADGGRPVDVVVDPENTNLLYAITSKGVHRSRDFGEEYLGKSWETLTNDLPPLNDAFYSVIPGKTGRIYAFTGKEVFRRNLGESEWKKGSNISFGSIAQPNKWIAVDPENPDHLTIVLKTQGDRRGNASLLLQSKDAGETWSPTIRDFYEAFRTGGFAAITSLYIPHDFTRPILMGKNGRRYAIGAKGVLISTNAGKSWREHQAGMEIPEVNHLFQPANTDWLFAGTPGGVYISKDGGENWEDGNLWMQFAKNTRRELGGAAFVDAYWRARYHGFIDDETAAAPME